MTTLGALSFIIAVAPARCQLNGLLACRRPPGPIRSASLVRRHVAFSASWFLKCGTMRKDLLRLSVHILKWSCPMHVNSKDAETAIKAAVKKAQALKTQMCIAVVDSGANLKAFHRMDDAWVGSIDIAIKKAKTAVFFGMPTGQIGQLSQPAGPLFGIEHSNNGLITFPGGLPIVDEAGVLVGAIGVSGSTVENDNAVALAGVKTIGVSDLPAHPGARRRSGGTAHPKTVAC